jgi:acyl-CoA synthetase (AMP-forming)/AMP-acid ligase II
MMGYAENRADLALGDVARGALATGDVGRLDADGLLYVTGRSKRFAKIAGLRCNLDHVERLAAAIAAPVAALASEDRLTLVWERGAEPDLGAAVRRLCRETALPVAALRPAVVDRLPLLASGKPDYAALRRAVGLPEA